MTAARPEYEFLAPVTALIACYIVFLGYVYLSYGLLPERVASHFDFAGWPNGWMTRTEIVEFTLALGILMPGFVVGMMAGIGWIPARFVNLPNRDYWLAPERLPATRAVLLRFGLWFACLNVIFVAGIHFLIVQANISGTARHLNGNGIGAVAGGFMLTTVVWGALLVSFFLRKPE